MKYCLNGRQNRSYLEKADEIYVLWRDRKILLEFIEKYPNSDFVIEIKPDIDEEIDWEYINLCNKTCKKTLYCKLYNLIFSSKCKEYDLYFFYAYPANSFFELNGLKEIGVSYVYLAAPLFFKTEEVIKYQIPIRYVPNLAYSAYIPHSNGIHGTWIRPEDIELYDNNNNICEFDGINLEQERLLYDIYKERKEWPGDLNLLFINFNHSVHNRIVDKQIGNMRLNCGQKCEEKGNCYLCNKILEFEQTLLKYKASKQKENN